MADWPSESVLGVGGAFSGPNSNAATPVLVAVVDSGAEVTHPMLDGYLIDGYNVLDGTDTVYDPGAPYAHSHGTHVIGNIVNAARGTGADVRVLPIQAFSNGSSRLSDVLLAIEFAEGAGAAIVNCSFGTARECPALADAIAGSGMLFVSSCGNARRDLSVYKSYPAAYQFTNTLSVASTNEDGGLSYFSNYGPADIAAQGRDVVSALPGGKTGPMSGTSMAAAFVAGSAAAVASLTDAESAEGIKSRLLHSADRLDNLEGKVTGGRRANLANALSGDEGEQLSLNPAYDYDVHGYIPGRGALFGLYSQSGGAAQVAAGGYHTLVLKEDGTVWSFGDNNYGQCGTGTFSAIAPISQVIGLSGIVEISAGFTHNLARKGDGSVWAWGSNSHGQLGDSSNADSAVPIQVLGIAGAEAVSAGHNTGLILAGGELVISGGDQYYGVAAVGEFGGGAIAAGEHHYLTTCGDGSAYALGYSHYGSMGLGFEDGYAMGQIPGLCDVATLAAGRTFSLAATESGDAYAWGKNGSRLGLGDTYWGNASSPEQLGIAASIASVAAGGGHALAIDCAGALWAWGENWEGQLGNGESGGEEWWPVQVSDAPCAISISAGESHSAAAAPDGSVWVWGSNEYGQLGLPPQEWAYSDIPVPLPLGGGDSPAPDSLSVQLTPAALPVPSAGYLGRAAAAVTAYDAYGNELENIGIEWHIQSSTAGVAIDPATGEVTVAPAASPGTVTVRAECVSDPAVSATADLTLYVLSSITVELEATTILAPLFGTATLAATARSQDGREVSDLVEWSLDPDGGTGAYVSAAGLVHVGAHAEAGQYLVKAAYQTAEGSAALAVARLAEAAPLEKEWKFMRLYEAGTNKQLSECYYHDQKTYVYGVFNPDQTAAALRFTLQLGQPVALGVYEVSPEVTLEKLLYGGMAVGPHNQPGAEPGPDLYDFVGWLDDRPEQAAPGNAYGPDTPFAALGYNGPLLPEGTAYPDPLPSYSPDERYNEVIWKGFVTDEDGASFQLGKDGPGCSAIEGGHLYAVAILPIDKRTRKYPSFLGIAVDYENVNGALGSGAYIGQYGNIVGDPLNIINGNFTWQYTDIESFGAEPLAWARAYNSLASGSGGPLGHGWRHSHQFQVEERPLTAKVTFPDGASLTYNKTYAGGFAKPAGTDYELARTVGGFA
ncbi:MAG: S8 family serine peptidase, partial [Oscillospiraceae bacterium]|nr:S8 family serine peptidase [Oscillospiraceae bacterium]